MERRYIYRERDRERRGEIVCLFFDNVGFYVDTTVIAFAQVGSVYVDFGVRGFFSFFFTS